MHNQTKLLSVWHCFRHLIKHIKKITEHCSESVSLRKTPPIVQSVLEHAVCCYKAFEGLLEMPNKQRKLEMKPT